MAADVNLISVVVGAVATALAGYFATRTIKRGDARAQAEAALIGIGPKIIEQQNVRIDNLSKQIEYLFTREQECRVELTAAKLRIETLENRASWSGDQS